MKPSRTTTVMVGLLLAATLAADLCHAESPLWSSAVPNAEGGRAYYVSVDGRPGNPGTKARPWDLVSVLAGRHKVAPGSVVWVQGGTYVSPNRVNGENSRFEAKMRGGSADRPVHVRAMPGERVTLDGGLRVSGGSHVWFWDMELLVSESVGKEPTTPTTGSFGGGTIPYPFGNLAITSGRGLKFINFNIHDCTAGGMDCWVGATDIEIHGTIVHTNGWRSSDRGHGHSLYTQNQTGTKTISGCIMSTRWSGQYTMHAYGSSRAYVDNYVVEDNVFHTNGDVLIGGGRPSTNIVARRNILYKVPLRLGYDAPYNNDCIVRDNVIIGSNLSIKNFKQVVNENNRIIRDESGFDTRLVPNKYDPSRAHVVAFNRSDKKLLSVSAMRRPVEPEGGKDAPAERETPWIKDGESYRLMNIKDLYGKPAYEGTCQGGKIAIPAPEEFNAYVVLKGSDADGSVR